ncbi:hypothetical protein [Agromyces humi]|uniref:hypothetical protein n=1 Tax=Agromyces humi TaxID=1766800 RepID=UPI00135BF1C0|nr:hypothetical protein [Agromyces humi]
MQTLNDVDAGVYAVITASGSRYVFDLDRREVVRAPHVAPNVAPDMVDAADLRRDGEAMPLYELVDITVGQSLVVWIGKVDDYAGYLATRRVSTDVQSIEPLTSIEQSAA